MIESLTKKYFSFLVTDFGFKRIPEYQFVREVHQDYIKNDIAVKIIYEGSYIVEVLRNLESDSGIFSPEKRTVDYDQTQIMSIDITESKSSRRFHQINELVDEPEKVLDRCSRFLLSNPLILDGDLKGIKEKNRKFR